MKIASFNVNSLRVRLPIVTQWLVNQEPDILCVQETKVQDPDFPKEVFEQIGYNFVFKGQKSYNGVAIFSRDKIANVQFGFTNEPMDQARLIKAKINDIWIVRDRAFSRAPRTPTEVLSVISDVTFGRNKIIARTFIK